MSHRQTIPPFCLGDLVNTWSKLWGLPDLSATISISFSSRLRSTLARCRPAHARVVLRADLRNADPSFIAEVLCHEVAHVATYRLHGRSAAPHGKEWCALVRAAGFEPRVRTCGNAPAEKPRRQHASGNLYEHRCPVCQIIRVARRPVVNWRCAECLDAGLEGALLITQWRADAEANRER